MCVCVCVLGRGHGCVHGTRDAGIDPLRASGALGLKRYEFTERSSMETSYVWTPPRDTGINLLRAFRAEKVVPIWGLPGSSRLVSAGIVSALLISAVFYSACLSSALLNSTFLISPLLISALLDTVYHHMKSADPTER